MRARREGFFFSWFGIFRRDDVARLPFKRQSWRSPAEKVSFVFGWGGVVGWVVGYRKKNGEEKFRVDEMLWDNAIWDRATIFNSSSLRVVCWERACIVNLFILFFFTAAALLE